VIPQLRFKGVLPVFWRLCTIFHVYLYGYPMVGLRKSALSVHDRSIDTALPCGYGALDAPGPASGPCMPQSPYHRAWPSFQRCARDLIIEVFFIAHIKGVIGNCAKLLTALDCARLAYSIPHANYDSVLLAVYDNTTFMM